MLEKLPAGVGRALKSVRPGTQALVTQDASFADVPDVIAVTSTAFPPDGPIPSRYTEDGEKLSPPLEWIGVPPEAQALVLLVEDADSPTFRPLVHAILGDLPPYDGGLAEGDLPASGSGSERFGMGRNSFLSHGWLPPDPPRGHGPHRYAFQMFALDEVPSFNKAPGRSALVAALRGHVIARGLLIGTYSRG
ncbi:YbhB/YbcL family Raf kinase inhibitor-like protein [Lichenicoccus sp.]|uniref:YbhB/YbcL family Raf kinase inhibitor-like protein n=1 Tax=Lichenicoccus sp. TaxID=2781899 RepID=UPI003D13B81C